MSAYAHDLGRFSQTLGHTFARPELLENALTHRSYSNERSHRAGGDNERLEFLGDAVVTLCVSALLCERFPDADEGELTRRRADLVSENGLAALARELDVGGAMLLGRGEERSGGREKPRLLASTLEACLGAVFLDAGSEGAFAVARKHFEPRIDSADPGATDFKSRVQMLIQSRGGPPPTYALLRTDGPEHARTFVAAIRVDSEPIAEGQGRSKSEAEQAAAAAALDILEEADDESTGPGER